MLNEFTPPPFKEPKEKEETFHYTAPDYDRLPPQEKLAKLKELMTIAKKLSHTTTMDRILRERYANKAASYEKTITEIEKSLK